LSIGNRTLALLIVYFDFLLCALSRWAGQNQTRFSETVLDSARATESFPSPVIARHAAMRALLFWALAFRSENQYLGSSTSVDAYSYLLLLPRMRMVFFLLVEYLIVKCTRFSSNSRKRQLNRRRHRSHFPAHAPRRRRCAVSELLYTDDRCHHASSSGRQGPQSLHAHHVTTLSGRIYNTSTFQETFNHDCLSQSVRE
jgi:hypothetical protein